MGLVKVLVVDDNEAIRLSLSAILERQGFAVSNAGDVSEALRYISAQQYDVLVSDLHMPGAGDGLTVVSAMRIPRP